MGKQISMRSSNLLRLSSGKVIIPVATLMYHPIHFTSEESSHFFQLEGMLMAWQNNARSDAVRGITCESCMKNMSST